MSEEFPFESNHIRYYTDRARFGVVGFVCLWVLLSLVSLLCWDTFANSWMTYEQMGVTAGLMLIVATMIDHYTSKKSRRVAREALDGNLIVPEHPRLRWYRLVYTMVHPSDVEMGRPILRFDPSNEITTVEKDGPAFFMTNAACISSSSRTRTDWYTEQGYTRDYGESEGFGSNVTYREMSYSYTEYTNVFRIDEFEFEITTRSEYVVGESYHLLIDLEERPLKICFNILQSMRV